MRVALNDGRARGNDEFVNKDRTRTRFIAMARGESPLARRAQLSRAGARSACGKQCRPNERNKSIQRPVNRRLIYLVRRRALPAGEADNFLLMFRKVE
jgi:hypothetical protein